MDEDKKKILMIVVIIICIGLAGGITYWTNRDGAKSGKYVDNTITTLICTNPQCGQMIEFTAEELRNEIVKIGASGTNQPGRGPLAFTCPHCGKKSCYIAEECPKCGEFFVPKYDGKDFPDRCPKCGYSSTEESRKKVGFFE